MTELPYGTTMNLAPSTVVDGIVVVGNLAIGANGNGLANAQTIVADMGEEHADGNV